MIANTVARMAVCCTVVGAKDFFMMVCLMALTQWMFCMLERYWMNFIFMFGYLQLQDCNCMRACPPHL